MTPATSTTPMAAVAAAPRSVPAARASHGGQPGASFEVALDAALGGAARDPDAGTRVEVTDPAPVDETPRTETEPVMVPVTPPVTAPVTAQAIAPGPLIVPVIVPVLAPGASPTTTDPGSDPFETTAPAGVSATNPTATAPWAAGGTGPGAMPVAQTTASASTLAAMAVRPPAAAVGDLGQGEAAAAVAAVPDSTGVDLPAPGAIGPPVTSAGVRSGLGAADQQQPTTMGGPDGRDPSATAARSAGMPDGTSPGPAPGPASPAVMSIPSTGRNGVGVTAPDGTRPTAGSIQSTARSLHPSADTPPEPVSFGPTLPPTSTVPAAPGPVGALPATVGPYTVAGLHVVPDLLASAVATRGGHQLTVELSPAALGPVRVRATLREGSVVVELTGGADIAREAMRGVLADLSAALSAAGVEADVTVRDSTFGGPGGDSTAGAPDRQHPAGGEGRAGAAATDDPPADAAVRWRPVGPAGSGTRLDVRV